MLRVPEGLLLTIESRPHGCEHTARAASRAADKPCGVSEIDAGPGEVRTPDPMVANCKRGHYDIWQ